uniref:Uncharacterized protein n=1 Tax=Amphiprion ocellaris TaxID=80972 RepID=A0A3Q1C6R3_AMPOC
LVSGNNRASILVFLVYLDTLDQDIILGKLETWVGLSWSTLIHHTSTEVILVFVVSILAPEHDVSCVVPFESISGPSLFNLYLSSLGQIINEHNVCYNNDAYDMIKFIPVTESWMCGKFLNSDKIEILVLGAACVLSTIIALCGCCWRLLCVWSGAIASSLHAYSQQSFP